MKFALIDRVVALEPGRSISAVKNLSLGEEYLQDHFPGFPVMPGVLMLEALVQAGAWLARDKEDFRHSTILLQQARALKFNNFVSPGRTLAVTVVLDSWGDDECVVKGTGTVDGASAVSAKLTLRRFNLADRNPALAENDRRLVENLRGQWRSLWTPPAG